MIDIANATKHYVPGTQCLSPSGECRSEQVVRARLLPSTCQYHLAPLISHHQMEAPCWTWLEPWQQSQSHRKSQGPVDHLVQKGEI